MNLCIRAFILALALFSSWFPHAMCLGAGCCLILDASANIGIFGSFIIANGMGPRLVNSEPSRLVDALRPQFRKEERGRPVPAVTPIASAPRSVTRSAPVPVAVKPFRCRAIGCFASRLVLYLSAFGQLTGDSPHNRYLTRKKPGQDPNRISVAPLDLTYKNCTVGRSPRFSA